MTGGRGTILGMADAFTPLPPAPSGARWFPVDGLKPGDTVLDIAGSGEASRVVERAPLRDLMQRRLDAPGRGTDDLWLWVTTDETQGLYEHAVHLVDRGELSERWAKECDLPEGAFFGVLRLALVPA